MQKRAEAVSALIVASDHPDLFLGVTHVRTKEVSRKLGDGVQISIPTETVEADELALPNRFGDLLALRRMLEKEELRVSGLSPIEEAVPLCNSLIPNYSGGAWLRAYLLHAPVDATVEILEHDEIGAVGWVPFERIENPEQTGWPIRSTLHETIQHYRRWKAAPADFDPKQVYQLRDQIPDDFYQQLAQTSGISTAEALYRSGLVQSPDLVTPWVFDRSLCKREYHP